MVRYDPYTDSFTGTPTKEATATINLDAFTKCIIQHTVEVSDESIEKIADAVVRKLAERKTEPFGKDINVRSKTEPIPHDDYIESRNDHLEAKCLECNNSKACYENHWEGCKYEPIGYEVTAVVGTMKDEQQKSCATCKHALGDWDGESNNCERCCGEDRRFYEPIEDEQTERSNE